MWENLPLRCLPGADRNHSFSWRFPLFPQILQGLLGVELGYPKPQASVGWRRGINNAPCRHWPPVLILLVDLGERSPLQLTLGAEWSLIIAKLPHHCGDSPLVWKLGIKSNLLLLSREVVYSVHYWRKCLLTREVEMHEYTCAVVSVLILCFFLVLRIFWEEQLAEQFWYLNFSLCLVVFWAEQ